MNRKLSMLAIAVIFFIIGCRDKASQIPSRSFRVTVKNLVEDSDLIVKHVIIETNRLRTVSAFGKMRDT